MKGLAVKNSKSMLGFAAAALMLTTSPAMARAIQIDQNWSEIAGDSVTNLQTLDSASTLNGMNFCTNSYTQVWTVTGAQTCVGTDPQANSATAFMQLLTVPNATGIFGLNTENSQNGQFRVRWGNPNEASGVLLNPGEFLFGEISFYSAGNGVSGDYNFEFAYGWLGSNDGFTGAYEYGISPGPNTIGRSQVINLTSSPLISSTGLSGNGPALQYCYRQAGGGQLGTVSAGGCSLDTASVPEPGTLALIVGAMGFLGLARRRRLQS